MSKILKTRAKTSATALIKNQLPPRLDLPFHQVRLALASASPAPIARASTPPGGPRDRSLSPPLSDPDQYFGPRRVEN